MATVEEGLRSQIRNIEATYGRSMAEWTAIVRAAGLTRHGQIVAMLKNDYGMSHGAANRTALVVLDAMAAADAPAGDHVDPVDQLYAGKYAVLRPLHDQLLAAILGFGGDVELAPKKAYLSVRRRTQFAMIQPAAGRLDVGLVLKGRPTTDRFQSAASFNALFTHRVRVAAAADIDADLMAWLQDAYAAAI